MIEDMQLRGLSARTQECYVTAVRQLAAHHHRSPDQLSEEDLRQYFLYLTNEKKVARATATIALCGIKFLFEHTLKRDWTTLNFVRPARERKLPVVLSREEVRSILAAVRIPVYRMCLTTIYACGLRLLEGVVLHIHGKRQNRPLRAAPRTDVTYRCAGALAETQQVARILANATLKTAAGDGTSVMSEATASTFGLSRRPSVTAAPAPPRSTRI
jgi:integrase